MLALRIYRFSLFGVAGGLAASLLHQRLLLDSLAGNLTRERRFLELALLGVLVGASIGFVPRFAEALGRYSLWRAARLGLLGAALGALGGALTLPLAEWLLSRAHGGLEGRALAWGCLGLALGFSEGFSGGSRHWRGLAGGLLGGLMSGILIELLLSHQSTYADSGIVALVLVGLTISLAVSLFVNVLSEVWLEGLPGSKVEGQVYHLSKFKGAQEAVLGSGKKGALLVWIPDAEERHATLSLRGDDAVLRHVARRSPTFVDGVAVSEHLLRDNQTIQIGTARLRYRERRRTLRLGAAAARRR